jgi:hypothetical protein
MQLRRAGIKAGAKPPPDLDANRCQRSSNQVVRKMATVIVTGASSMDNLPAWAASIIAVAVGLSPGLAILSARRIAWLLHRVLWPRPEVALQTGREPERPAVAAPLG